MRHAFTLVEVLIVVTITGIAAAVVVPQMMQSGQLTIQGAARMMIADLLLAQNEAVAQQSPIKVVFDADNERYKITDSNDETLTVSWENGGSNNYDRELGKPGKFNGVGIDNVTFSGNVIEFDALGSPSNGGSVDLVSGQTTYRITVAALTGRVSLEPVAAGG